MAILTFKKYNRLYEANQDSTSFDQQAKPWYDKITVNVNRWHDQTILSLLNQPPTKKTLVELRSIIFKGPNRPGKDEIIDFMDNLLLNAYREDFPKLEGPTGAIHEFFLLFKQSIDG